MLAAHSFNFSTVDYLELPSRVPAECHYADIPFLQLLGKMIDLSTKINKEVELWKVWGLGKITQSVACTLLAGICNL